MTVDEVKILLSDLNRGYNTPYSSAEQATIERLYYEVLGKHLNGCRCPDKWHDAVLEINSYIKKHGKMKEKSNYKLRERSEEHTSELQSLTNLVCRLLLEKNAL